ncbi:MAG: DUF3341 domain-containing protein [Calditrichaeota bacterium]|nr:DUF3341 domain-containing protein [Calditrichota bacterium]
MAKTYYTPNRRQLLGVFETEKAILAATRAAREGRYRIVDVHTPYAVHGLDRAMGLRPSRLPWAALLLGFIGAAFKVWFEYWTTGVSWPIDVGGKPFDSLPAFVPVTFEVMVLFAGVGTVFTFLIARRLLPGRSARLPHPDVTTDRFVIILEESDAAFDPVEVKALFRTLGAVEVLERETSEVVR